MPLTRYQIRNEYASSDPEVYLQADKDDPEALLEGVSMAGLVGILRQLGDLSEFAADLFHDLHEEVLATASRGHGLMVRVQQLETEFPLIEKALLSQMNHSSFFYGARVDWHPSMRSQENLIAQGELPRFIMDSYEECRGPPRLFYLDKFDVAGAGACLKRYTDPALFKEGTALEDTHREKKVRRIKKKGMRGKNGETPEFMQTPHAKLHQLFLKERVEISNINPSQIVKLKRRQFNESSFCSKNGKSYMEKFVDSPYPDSKTILVDPAARPALQWTSDGNVPEANDIHSVSPTEIGSRLMDNASTSIRQTFSEKSSFENLEEMVTNEKKMVESAPPPDEVAYEIFDAHDVQEMQLAEMTGRIENGVDGFRSDEITSEVENYVDAVATLESELDAESELEAKTSKRFYNARKHETDSITADDQVEHQFQFSDSQSWDYSVSDDGNTFVRKGSSTFSYSDGQSNLNENILSDSEGIVGRAFPSSEAGTSKYVLDNQIRTKENMLQETSDKLMMPTSLKEEAIYTNPLSTASNDNLFPNDFRENYDHAFSSDVPSENREECLSRLTSENQLTNVEEVEESTVSSDLLQHRSSSLDLPYVAESDTSHRRRAFNSDEDGELISDEKFKSGLSFAEMSQEDPLHTSRLPEITDSSGFTLFCHGSPASFAIDVDVHRPCSTVVSEDVPPVAEPNTEHCAAMEDILHIESKEQDHSLSVDAPIHEQNATIDRCHDDERKLDENLHASRAVGDIRLAWKKQIDVNAISCDACSTSSDDHLASLDDVDMEPSAKVTSGGILSACNENIVCTDSIAVDAVSILYPELVGSGPAISYNTEIEPVDTTGSYDVTNEEEVFQAEQCSSQSDLKSQVDFKFEKDERPSSFPEESLVISDSQGNWLPNKESEYKPTCESDLLSSSESNLSPLGYQEVEHGVRLERPLEFQADAPSAKFQNKDEISSESICHPPERMKSFNLICHEDILSKPGPTGESSLELGNHKVDGEFLKDSKVISCLPGLQSDIVQPSDGTIEDKGSVTSKSYADDQWSQFPCSKPSEQPVLPLVRQNKPDQALFSVVSACVYQEYVPPTFPADPPVYSIEDGGCLKSSSPIAVDQSPAPDYMSRASPVSLQTQIWNSITVVPHEDSEEKGLEQVPNPKNLQNIDDPAKNILPYLEKEKVQSAFLPAERMIDCTSGQPATSTCPRELPATSSESSSVFEGTEWPLVFRTSEAENGSLTGGSAHSEMRQDERLGHGSPGLEGEAASVPPEESEVAEPITSNIARPPKRLIEAVAAHNRSMLRKVTERIRPPLQPAVSGDSFLELIRTKSFNLKPAVATRPSIQGPKTNLKVAAILEKANTIRQACAGSDEDDDDSWSDS